MVRGLGRIGFQPGIMRLEASCRLRIRFETTRCDTVTFVPSGTSEIANSTRRVDERAWSRSLSHPSHFEQFAVGAEIDIRQIIGSENLHFAPRGTNQSECRSMQAIAAERILQKVHFESRPGTLFPHGVTDEWGAEGGKLLFCSGGLDGSVAKAQPGPQLS